MKSLVTLLTVMLDELGHYCAVDTLRDVETFTNRSESEGMPFLGIVLPRLGSSLERGLASGKFSTPSGFKQKGELPEFLGGFFELVFDRASGSILETPSIEAIRSIRQFTLSCKKIELDCSSDAIAAAYDAYIQSDLEVGEWEARADIDQLIRFYEMGQLLFSTLFRRTDLAVEAMDITPRHGSGAVADRLAQNAKWSFPSWSDRLEEVFPLWRYGTTRPYSSSVYTRTDFQEPGAETPVKVTHVPKTLATPRIIAEEPAHNMWIQQGLFRHLDEGISRSYLRDFVGTDSQLPNQELARLGSIDGSLATLDLSEASDRVANLLVETLTSGFPHFQDAVRACRSTRATVPGHGVHTLSRYASMGSALTFPMEQLVFLTVLFLGLEDAYGHRIRNRQDVLAYRGRVRVFGDDIIVPVDSADTVIATLESFGFRVNNHKSFWTGKFRESCGAEYFEGNDVTFCKVRRLLPRSRADVEQVVSAVSLRNRLYKRGLWKTAAWMDDFLLEIIPFPVVMDTSVVLGRISCLGIPDYEIGGRYQLPLVKGLVPKARKRRTQAVDDAALLKSLSLLRAGDQSPRDWWNPPGSEADHLDYAGRPEATAINLRKAPAL